MALLRVLVSVVVILPLGLVLTIAAFWIVGTLEFGFSYDEEPTLFLLQVIIIVFLAAASAAAIAHTVNRLIFGRRSATEDPGE
jgi:hypothetical protein